MAALAAREILGARALDAVFDSQALRWHRYRFASEAAIPGIWLLFALTFARANPMRFVRPAGGGRSPRLSSFPSRSSSSDGILS